MLNVGIIGLGMMGLTHIDVWCKRSDAKVYAIADKDTKRLNGETAAEGNLDGLAETTFDYDTVKKYEDAFELINDPEIDIVDICLPTHLHLMFTEAAIKAGKHVLVEKPLARHSGDAIKMVELANNTDKMVMPAMCMRFWPGWDWLKQTVDNKTFGRVLSASFKRVGGRPEGPFYENGELNGGGLLDIHIHDTDFISYIFGMPKAVYSRGYSSKTSEVDHLVTNYIYDDVPMVTAEGGWWPVDNCPFIMQYQVTFEKATAFFDIANGHNIKLIESGSEEETTLEMSEAMGYDGEIDYFVQCVKENKKPTVVSPLDGANTILIAEAERASVLSGSIQAINA